MLVRAVNSFATRAKTKTALLNSVSIRLCGVTEIATSQNDNRVNSDALCSFCYEGGENHAPPRALQRSRTVGQMITFHLTG